MVLYSVCSSVIASVVGTYASFLLDASTGACIVLAQASLFILALFLAPKKGLLASRRRRPRRSGAEPSTNPVEI
jgi:ABC-type Mn2+/Zn2+ transport system permease subunit